MTGGRLARTGRRLLRCAAMILSRATLPLAGLLAIALASPIAAAKAPAKTRATASTAAIKPHGLVLPFIENDYTRAVAQARTNKLPIFVEAWAPW